MPTTQKTASKDAGNNPEKNAEKNAQKTGQKDVQKDVQKAVQKAAAPSPRRSTPHDALALLKADHKAVKALFKDYQDLADAEAGSDERQQLAERICMMLTVHATIEEELFYPPAREALGDDADLIDEADVEHASAKDLIAQIQQSTPEDLHYDAKVKVLGEYIDHHVKEEEGEMFTKLKKTDLALDTLGEKLAARKEALMEEIGLSDDEPAPAAKPSKKTGH